MTLNLEQAQDIGRDDDHLTPQWVLDRTDRTGSCWLWTGPILKRYDGAGDRAVARRHGHTTTAARHLWTEVHGEIPNGYVVRHVCDNPMCMRLSHLSLGTPQQNAWDAIRRGKIRPGGNPPMVNRPNRAETARILGLHARI